jgi:MFS family permease
LVGPLRAHTQPRRPSSTRKVVAASPLGAAIEWYDFIVNASAATPAPTASVLAGWQWAAVGRRAIYLAGTAFGTLLALWLFDTRNATSVTLAIVLGIRLCQGVVCGPHARFMPDLRGTNARFGCVPLVSGSALPLVAGLPQRSRPRSRPDATWLVSMIPVAFGALAMIAALSTRAAAARPMRS